MPNAHDLIRHIETLVQHPLYRDEGVHHGDADRPVKKAVVCWMASADAIAFAGAAGADLLIAHEGLYYPYAAEVNGREYAPGWERWPTNVRRRELLERHDLTMMRAHTSADEICVFDAYAELLELGAPTIIRGPYTKAFDVEPQPLRAMIERVKRCLNMPLLRVSAPHGPEQIVRRIGLPWGGLGLFVNVAYQQALMDMDADCFIGGESDSYAFRFAADSGIPFIETGHELSENPGLRRFGELLGRRFPEIAFSFYACDSIWRIV